MNATLLRRYFSWSAEKQEEFRLRVVAYPCFECGGSGDWMVLRSDVMAVKAELCSPSGWLRLVCDETAVREFLEL